MAAHTKEPWSQVNTTLYAGGRVPNLCDKIAGFENQSDATHAQQCHNAMIEAEIENPAAIPEAVKALQAALYIRYLESSNSTYRCILRDKGVTVESHQAAREQMKQNRESIATYYKQIKSALKALELVELEAEEPELADALSG